MRRHPREHDSEQTQKDPGGEDPPSGSPAPAWRRNIHVPSDSSFRVVVVSASELPVFLSPPHALPLARRTGNPRCFPFRLQSARAAASFRFRVFKSHASAAGDEYLGAGGASGLGAVLSCTSMSSPVTCHLCASIILTSADLPISRALFSSPPGNRTCT